MTGLDKIISQILEDAGNEAQEISRKAKSGSEEILAEARDVCKKIAAENDVKLAGEATSYMERIKSNAELKKRQAVLLAKQQVISEMLNQAYEALLQKEGQEYFALIGKMLDKFVLPKEGEIYFSKKDLERMPQGFEAEIEKAASSKGGRLTLVREPMNIDGGFILVYGGTQENCSFRALIAARRDELSDKVHALLFS